MNFYEFFIFSWFIHISLDCLIDQFMHHVVFSFREEFIHWSTFIDIPWIHASNQSSFAFFLIGSIICSLICSFVHCSLTSSFIYSPFICWTICLAFHQFGIDQFLSVWSMLDVEAMHSFVGWLFGLLLVGWSCNWFLNRADDLPVCSLLASWLSIIIRILCSSPQWSMGWPFLENSELVKNHIQVLNEKSDHSILRVNCFVSHWCTEQSNAWFNEWINKEMSGSH